MPVGIGARQFGGDLGAVDRRRHDAEGIVKHGNIETGEMEDLRHVRVGEEENFLEIGRPGLALFPICTTSAVPSPRDNCTTHNRSRCGCRPSVSVSIVDGVAEAGIGGQVTLCRRMVIGWARVPPAEGWAKRVKSSLRRAGRSLLWRPDAPAST